MAQQSRLLALPAELRICVYEHVFTPNLYSGPEVPDPSDRASHKLSLLRTCRQLRNETWKLAYARTTFHIPTLITPLLDRLFRLNVPLRHTLRYVTITINLSISPKILGFLDSWLMELPLEQLTISIGKLHPLHRPSSFLTDEPASIEEARGVSYIRASVRFQVQMKNLRRAIFRGLQEPSGIKRITILSQLGDENTQFMRLYQNLHTLVRDETEFPHFPGNDEHVGRWSLKFDPTRHAIQIVGDSAIRTSASGSKNKETS